MIAANPSKINVSCQLIPNFGACESAGPRQYLQGSPLNFVAAAGAGYGSLTIQYRLEKKSDPVVRDDID